MSERPNVVWLTLESTRQDHTTMGGYRRDTTPQLARLAGRPGWRAFDACFSHGIWTLASTASILTGTVPSAHGTGMTNGALPDRIGTVPERLGAAGYHTECISPNPHLSTGTNLDRGFDEFTFVEKGSLLGSVGWRSLLRYGLNVRRHGGGFSLESRRHTPDFVMTDLAKRRLGAFAGGDPFFLYVHYAGPHRPYFPPRRFRERFCADGDLPLEAAGDVALDHHEHCWRHIAEGCPFSDAEWDAIEAHYDGEIAHTDELVGDLVAHLADLDLGRTVVVVTGDHGEYFGEEGLLGHNVGVHDAVSHVPLVIGDLDSTAAERGPAVDDRPGSLADDGGPDPFADDGGPDPFAGERGADPLAAADDGDRDPLVDDGRLAVEEGGLVQHVDVIRTLLALGGADTDGVHGVDLRTDEREHAFVQRGADRCRKRFRQLRALDPDFDTDRYHDGQLTALRTRRFKYRHSEDRAELLALPDEETDVSGDYPGVRDRLDGALEEWLGTVGRPLYSGRVEESFDDDMRSQLADLGYLVE